MPTRRTPSADVRAALLGAAVAVLERDGYAGLTVRAVAAEAGVAPMGVYNHLDGKDGLLAAVLADGYDGLLAGVARRPDLPPAVALREAGHGYRRFALSRPVTYGLMFSTTVGLATNEVLQPHAGPAFMALVELVAINQAAGLVLVGPPQLVAMSIWAAVHGAVSLELAGALVTGEPDEIYEGVLDMISAGLRPAGSAGAPGHDRLE